MCRAKSVLLVCLALTVPLMTEAEAVEDSDLIRVLLITGQMNKHHDADLMDQAVTRYLENAGLFEIEVARTPPRGENMSGFLPDFSGTDVVVLNYDGDHWPKQTRTEFENWVRGGGGLVTVHSSDNAFPDWHAFLEMTGVGGWNERDESWGSAVRWGEGGMELYDPPPKAFHPPVHAFEITIRDPGHPITRGLPSSWLHAPDELYSGLRGPVGDLRVLATGFANPEMKKASGYHEPVLMTIRYGEGRIFHTTLGHIPHKATKMPASVLSAAFATTLQRGTEWAARGRVTQMALTPLSH